MSKSANGISPAGRTKIMLGDIARNISENEYNPKEKGLDRCVGLEHLDPGSLKISRWSPITPEMSFTRRFCRGQILFGKRRAYQKKVALADFDGICSSDILVIEAKKENFVPELLPYILQDDRFFEYAVGTSSGSLSPRTKWKFLAVYEIWLPSPYEQLRIANMLSAAEDCIVKGERFVAMAERAKQVLLKEIFERSLNGGLKNWEKTSLSKCIVERSAGSQPPHKKIKYVGLEHFESGNHQLVSYGDSEKFGSNCSVFEKGDILYSKLRPYLDKAAIADFDGVCTTEVIVLNANEKTTNKFLINLLHSKKFIEWITHRSYGTKMPRTSIDLIGKYIFSLPPLPEQRQIEAILTRCDETITAARANVVVAKAMKMKMINEMLGGFKDQTIIEKHPTQ